MLLVDHREPEPPERHGFLDQRVRPHHEARRPGGDSLPRRLLVGGAEPPDEHLGAQVERLEQPRQRGPVLLGQELGRRHDRRLVVVLQRDEHRE